MPKRSRSFRTESRKKSTPSPSTSSPSPRPQPKQYVPTAELEEATALYKTVQAATTGMSRATKRVRLEKASILYSSELKRCFVLQDYTSAASILRNEGMTNLRLAEVVDNLDPLKEFSEIVHFLRESIKSFFDALQVRRGDLNMEWGIGVQQKIHECFRFGISRGNGRDDLCEGAMMGKLSTLFDVIPLEDEFNLLRSKCYMIKSKNFHKMALIMLESCDEPRCTRFLEAAREDCALAEKFSRGNTKLVAKSGILRQEILMLQCQSESVRMRAQADLAFDVQLTQNESVDFRMIWTIVDMYKEAVLLTREIDIENEAFALSRLGRIFGSVLKMPVKSREYYRTSFDLVQTLFPKDMSKMDWYSECKQALEKFQRIVVVEEQRREEAEKAPILEKLTVELQELKNYASEPVNKITNFLYAKYPPKVKHVYNKKDSLLEYFEQKQVLKEAISHYHPDRQSSFGLDWKVLCGEICKVLTARYETFK